MHRKINVVTTCFHEEYRVGATPEENLQKALDMLDSFKNLKPDLVCFPEIFLESGVKNRMISVPMSGMLLDSLGKKARELNCYIAASGYETSGPNLYNAAWLIDRRGQVAGSYYKYYPTVTEIERGIKPGKDIPVFKTDFGTLGMLICFDIDWPEIWNALAAKGAEMVVWLSAYEGGYPLQAYAALNFYYVVSSVRVSISKIIDMSGKLMASTSKWMGWAVREINLEKKMFHLDGHFGKLAEMQKALGSKITIECLWEEGRFTLQSNDSQWPLERIMKEFQLETFHEYHRRTNVIQEKYR